MHIASSCETFHPAVSSSPSPQDCSTLFVLQSVLTLGIAVTKVQDVALVNAELNEGHFSSLCGLWMASVPSSISTAPLTLVSYANLLRMHSIPLCHWWRYSIVRSQYGPLRDTTCYWFPFGHRAIYGSSLDATIQPISYPSHSPFIKSISLPFRGNNVVGDHIKGLTDVQEDGISHSSLVHWCNHFTVEGHLDNQSQFAYGEAMFAGLSHLLVFCMFWHVFQEDCFMILLGTEMRLTGQ